jgi:hypothetical protein
MISSISGDSGKPCGSFTSTGLKQIPHVSSSRRTRRRSALRLVLLDRLGFGFVTQPSTLS